jgi:hypothetical protein
MEEDGQFSKHMDACLGGGAIAYLEAMAEYLGLTDGKHTAAVICSFFSKTPEPSNLHKVLWWVTQFCS